MNLYPKNKVLGDCRTRDSLAFSLSRPGIALSPRPNAAFRLHQVAENIVDAGQVALAFGTQPIEDLGIETDAYGEPAPCGTQPRHAQAALRPAAESGKSRIPIRRLRPGLGRHCAASRLGRQSPRGRTHCGKGWFSGEMPERHPSGAKAHADFAAFTARLKSCPFKAKRFSAACKAQGPAGHQRGGHLSRQSVFPRPVKFTLIWLRLRHD